MKYIQGNLLNIKEQIVSKITKMNNSSFFKIWERDEIVLKILFLVLLFKTYGKSVCFNSGFKIHWGLLDCIYIY